MSFTTCCDTIIIYYVIDTNIDNKNKSTICYNNNNNNIPRSPTLRLSIRPKPRGRRATLNSTWEWVANRALVKNN